MAQKVIGILLIALFVWGLGGIYYKAPDLFWSMTLVLIPMILFQFIVLVGIMTMVGNAASGIKQDVGRLKDRLSQGLEDLGLGEQSNPLGVKPGYGKVKVVDIRGPDSNT